MASTPYANLSREELISRLQALERSRPDPRAQLPDRPGKKPFDFASHPRRKIALKFCYAGWEYNGLAIQDETTPLPTVEEVLFKALAKTRLIDPAAGMEGCGWSRCGRTDRGVSAAGQVVSLWVRSNLGPRGVSKSSDDAIDDVGEDSVIEVDQEAGPSVMESTVSSPQASSQREIRYIHALNLVLPPTIRILAWSPVAPDFDARFSCQYRHYKYIFTTGTSPRNDIAAMRDAAARLVGEHDFRNMCKLDATKQITNYRRTILNATIEPFQQFLDADYGEDSVDHPASGHTATMPGLYLFDLVGTAFLYHQVRHIMAILFLVGAGLEPPNIIDALMNVTYDSESPEPTNNTHPTSTSSLYLPVVETKPNYRMADALPLVLWDCAFLPSDVAWQNDAGEPTPAISPRLSPRIPSHPQVAQHQTTATSPSPAKHASNEPSPPKKPSHEIADLFRELHATWTKDIIRTSISSLFLQASRSYPFPLPSRRTPSLPVPSSPSQSTPDERRRGPSPRRRRKHTGPDDSATAVYDLGGGVYRNEMRYVPLLDRPRGQKVEDINNKWKEGTRGRRILDKMKRKAEERENAREANPGSSQAPS